MMGDNVNPFQRAICAMGEATADTLNPLLHGPQDRQGFWVENLKVNDNDGNNGGSSGAIMHSLAWVSVAIWAISWFGYGVA